MQSITRGTTPKIRIGLPTGLAVSDIAELWLTLKQGSVSIDKTLEDMSDEGEGLLSVTLSQTETLRLDENGGAVCVQVRLRTRSGEAAATEIVVGSAAAILRDGEI